MRIHYVRKVKELNDKLEESKHDQIKAQIELRKCHKYPKVMHSTISQGIFSALLCNSIDYRIQCMYNSW
jgi:hypothetical protein